MRSSFVVGAGVKCYINGNLMGEATGFSFSSDTPHRQVRGVDSAEPYELATTITNVRGKVTMIRLSGFGALEGRGITDNFKNLVLQKYNTIELIDRSTNLPIFHCDRAVVMSQSWNVSARGVCSGEFDFEGIEWNNEASQ